MNERLVLGCECGDVALLSYTDYTEHGGVFMFSRVETNTKYAEFCSGLLIKHKHRYSFNISNNYSTTQHLSIQTLLEGVEVMNSTLTLRARRSKLKSKLALV